MTVAVASVAATTPAVAGPANTCGTSGTAATGYTLGTLGPGLPTNQLAFTDPAGPWGEGLYITNPHGPPAVLKVNPNGTIAPFALDPSIPPIGYGVTVGEGPSLPGSMFIAAGAVGSPSSNSIYAQTVGGSATLFSAPDPTAGEFSYYKLAEIRNGPSGDTLSAVYVYMCGGMCAAFDVKDIDAAGNPIASFGVATPGIGGATLPNQAEAPSGSGFSAKLYAANPAGVAASSTYGGGSVVSTTLPTYSTMAFDWDVAFGGGVPGFGNDLYVLLAQLDATGTTATTQIWRVKPSGAAQQIADVAFSDIANDLLSHSGGIAFGRGGNFGKDLYFSAGDTICKLSAPDQDNDGVPDAVDNCPTIANANQANADGDARGDACDLFPTNPSCTVVPGSDARDASLAWPWLAPVAAISLLRALRRRRAAND